MKTGVKRTTIYLDSVLHRALHIKAAGTERTLSELIGEAIRLSLAEDSIDIEAFEERKREPSMSFTKVLKQLKKNGKI